ncbi:unnamed protein product, partial [Oikopleura dioica]
IFFDFMITFKWRETCAQERKVAIRLLELVRKVTRYQLNMLDEHVAFDRLKMLFKKLIRRIFCYESVGRVWLSANPWSWR